MNHQSFKLPELGLVCITASEQVRFKALTRKRLLALESAEQQRLLRELYAENLRRLRVAIDFCVAHQIRLYRLISALFPFADDPLGEGSKQKEPAIAQLQQNWLPTLTAPAPRMQLGQAV